MKARVSLVLMGGEPPSEQGHEPRQRVDQDVEPEDEEVQEGQREDDPLGEHDDAYCPAPRPGPSPPQCSGLRRILEGYRSVALVGEASGPPVRDLVRACAPHVLLIDAQTEGVIAMCLELGQLGIRPRVILAGADRDDAWALRALKAGARGILAKSATVENLMKAVRVVHQGEVWASKRVLTLAVEELAAHSIYAGHGEPAIKSRLSRREQDIAQLIASGLSNQEVARRLAITEATVKAHLTHIFQKLMLRGRGQLAALYHQSLLPPATGNGAWGNGRLTAGPGRP